MIEGREDILDITGGGGGVATTRGGGHVSGMTIAMDAMHENPGYEGN